MVDLNGGLVAPGFVDAYVHPVQGGLERTRCDLSGAHTREEYLATVHAYVRAHPELPWILGGGWAMAAFPGGNPTADDLDAVAPDRPVRGAPGATGVVSTWVAGEPVHHS